jgi:hypothetical protein
MRYWKELTVKKQSLALIICIFLSFCTFNIVFAGGLFLQDAKEEDCQDTDKDGVCDNIDNCVDTYNPDQADWNFDGVGDACEKCKDYDQDGVCDTEDNCVQVANPDQADSDADGIGDACDPCNDRDQDGVCDPNDNCIDVPNPDQVDSDNDGIGDACDPCNDMDRDGVCDPNDNCIDVPNPDQIDSDADGIGDACDTEDTITPLGGQVGADVLETQGGYFHPYLLVDERWTDNLYYTNSNKEEEFVTSINPGMWVAFPANRERLMELSTATASPGGLKLSRRTPQTIRKFQSYLSYGPTFEYFANNSEYNGTTHQLDGLLQYKMDSGISFDVMDQFNDNYEANEYGTIERLDEYRDNLFGAMLYTEREEKLNFRVDYSNYNLSFDDSVNDYRDRIDNSYAFYVFYRAWPKSSVFLEYDFADITYDTNSASDSKENRYYLGYKWDVTAKTSGSIKLGYMEKDFDNSDDYDDGDISVEVQTEHTLSPKRTLKFSAYRLYNESTMLQSPAYLTTGVTAAWLQRFTEKWSGTLSCEYAFDDYNGLISIGSVSDNRKDVFFSVSPAIRFQPRDWLYFDLGYMFRNRDSNFESLDYSTNMAFFNVDFFL